MSRTVFTIVAAAAMFSLGSVAQAQTVEQILGPWRATINAAGQERNMDMLLTQEAGVLGLTLSTPQGDQAAEDVTLTGNVLSFKLKFGPADLAISVTIEGETFSGQADSPFGPLDIKGKKISAAELAEREAELMPLVGDWDIVTEFQGKRIESGFRIKLEDGRLMGADTSGRGGIDAEGFIPIGVRGDRMFWRIPIPYVTQRGGEVQVTLNREQMKFAGKVESSLGEIPIEGKYVDTTKLVQTPYDDPTPVVGDWDIEVTMGGETAPAKMTLALVGERLHAYLNSAIGNYESTSVEYNKIGETMGTIRVHAQIPTISEEELVFEFIVDGDTFEGEEINTQGEILVSGKKISSTPSPQNATAAPAAGGGVTAAQVMLMLDRDKDGFITLEESPDQLKQFFSVVDANADGKIDAAEAQTIADFMSSQGGGSGGGAASTPEPQANAATPQGALTASMVLATADADRDGKIVLEETPEELKGFFPFVDRNKDGGIDETESQVVADVLNLMAQGGLNDGVTAEVIMVVLDANKDSKITMDESPDELKQFFSVVDSNADGGVDATEAIIIADFVNAQAAQPQS